MARQVKEHRVCLPVSIAAGDLKKLEGLAKKLGVNRSTVVVRLLRVGARMEFGVELEGEFAGKVGGKQGLRGLGGFVRVSQV